MEEKTFVEGFHDVEKIRKVKYNNLGETGLRVSTLSIGGASVGNCYQNMTEEQSIKMVRDGLRAGLNYIDTSPYYGSGRSEEVIGKALKGIPRKSFIIATKVGRYSTDIETMFDFSSAAIHKSIDRSLKRLGVDYVDVVQVHDIEFAEDVNQVIQETLPAVAEIVAQRKARFIGITSYNIDLMRDVIEKSKVKVNLILSYGKSNFLDDNIKNYIPFFKSKGIGIITSSPTGMGLLASGGPPDWHLADEDLLKATEKARNICKDQGIEPAHLALKSSLEIEGISTCLVGCTSDSMLQKSIEAANTPFTDAEKNILNTIEETCFKNLKRRDWGDKFVKKYFQDRENYRKEKKEIDK